MCVCVLVCVCTCEILRNFGSVGGAALSSQAYHGDEDRMFLGCLVHHICVAPSHCWHQRFILIAIRIIQSASKQYKESCWVVYLATSLCLPLWSCARYHLQETVTDTHIFWVICRVCVPPWKLQSDVLTLCQSSEGTNWSCKTWFKQQSSPSSQLPPAYFMFPIKLRSDGGRTKRTRVYSRGLLNKPQRLKTHRH